MLNSDEHIKKWLSNAFKYLNEKSSFKSRNSFERDLEKDPFDKDAFEGFREFSVEELEQDLQFLDKKLSNRIHKKSRISFLRIAAGIALIASLSFSYYFIFERQVEDISGNFEVSENVRDEEQKLPDSLDLKVDRKEEKDKNFVLSKKETVPEEIREKKDITKEEIIVEVNDEIELEEIIFEDGTSSESPDSDLAFDVSTEEEVSVSREIPMPESYKVSQRKKAVIETALEEESSPTSRLMGKVISPEDNSSLSVSKIQLEDTKPGTLKGQGEDLSTSKSDSEHITKASNIGIASESIAVSDKGFISNASEEGDFTAFDETISAKGEETGFKSSFNLEAIDLDPEHEYIDANPVCGLEEFKKYIDDNYIFPTEVDSLVTRGVVLLGFDLDPSGKPQNFRIIRSSDQLFSDEAIRLIENGPLWNPAKHYEEILNDEILVKIVFRK